jgi:hypothetical protein
MEMKKLLICAIAGMFLLSPVIAEFQVREGEKATYESFQDNSSQGKAISCVEGRYKIENVVTRRFSMTAEAGGSVCGYLDSGGKPVRLEIYSPNSTKADMTVAFKGNAATITYTLPASLQTTTPQQAENQSVTVNITSNTYDSTFYRQSIRYLPIKVGYTKNFQLFDPTIAMIMPESSSMNATLKITGREKITVGNFTYDCYKGTIRTEIPQFLQSLMQMAGQQPITEQTTSVWLRVSDLLLVREYSSISAPVLDPQTNTTQTKTTTTETILVDLSYA